MKYAMYVIPAIILVYWAIEFFALHAQPSIHILLVLAAATFFISYQYNHGHFLE